MISFTIALGILITVALVCIAIAIIVPVHEFDDKQWAVVFGIFFAASVGVSVLGINWDCILVSRADQFMLTRDAAYACADKGPLSCQKSILEWQKDSAWFADHVSDILKNIKETK